MSNSKRGETFCGPAEGPYYSRYTEHKVVLNLHAPTPPSPHRSLSADNTNSSISCINKESQSINNLCSCTKGANCPSTKHRSICNHRSYSTGESPLDFTLSLSRDNSSDGSFSPYTISPSESRAISPNNSLNDNSLSKFRFGSLDSSCISPSSESVDSAKERRLVFSNSKTKGKFAKALDKHAVSIFAAAAFKSSHEKLRSTKFAASCPDLIKGKKTPELPVKVNSSVSALDSIAKKGIERVGSGKNNLKVPDIFTTSFTHSNHTEAKNSFQVSSLSLHDFSCQTKKSEKSEKTNCHRTLHLTHSDPNNLKIGSLVNPKMYRDEQIAQITEYLFIGSIESAYNERRLCRLEIESLVDISNLNEMQVPPQKKLSCPCLCQIEFKHFRSRLIIAVPDEENEEIDQYFEEVNKFVEGARRCSKKVLIYSYEGKSRAAVFAVQYLMAYEGLLLRQAYNMVKKQRPQVSLNPAFQRSLEKLEKTLFPDEKHSVNICNEYLNVADPQAIKCAWIDC